MSRAHSELESRVQLGTGPAPDICGYIRRVSRSRVQPYAAWECRALSRAYSLVVGSCGLWAGVGSACCSTHRPGSLWKDTICYLHFTLILHFKKTRNMYFIHTANTHYIRQIPLLALGSESKHSITMHGVPLHDVSPRLISCARETYLNHTGPVCIVCGGEAVVEVLTWGSKA